MPVVRAQALVVGGGPAGSTAARILSRDNDVLLVEEHMIPGQPLQCAGLVTPRGIPRFARESVVGEVKGIRFHSPSGFVLSLHSVRPRACVVDRSHFDRIMFHKAVDSGAVPLVGTSVKSLIDSGKGITAQCRSEGTTEAVFSQIAIGADGYRSMCRRAAHLPPPKHMLTGIQVDLKGVDLDPDFVEVFLGRQVAPGFFAWAIPAGDIARVGLCTWDVDEPPVVFLKKLLSRPEFSHARRVSAASGKVPIGHGKSAVRGRIMLVGDAACHPKPLSGGGVYTGIRGAELCAEVAGNYLQSPEDHDLREYDSLWLSEFGRELSKAFRLRKIFLNLDDKKLDKALRMFNEPSLKRFLEERGDIDYPASLSPSVLKLVPRLAQFSPQIVESLL